MLEVKVIPCLSDNYTYLVRCEETKKTAAIDPGEAQPILNELKQTNWELNQILITHNHHDHIGGVVELFKNFPKIEIIGAKAQAPNQTQFVIEGDKVLVGTSFFEVISCAGHTSKCINYYDAKNLILFSGDTLFLAGCGRLLGGTAEQLYTSFNKIKQLPTATKIYFGHNYSLKNLEFALSVEPNNSLAKKRYLLIKQNKEKFTAPTTIDAELSTNPFLRLDSKEIIQSVSDKTNSKINNALDLFTKLRQLKDSF